MCDSVKCIDLRNGFVWVHRLCGWINVDTKRSSRVMPKFLIPNRIVALALALDVLKRVNRAQVICTFQFDARDTNTLLIMLKRNETQQNYVELNSSLKILFFQRNILAIL
jgi:hypothetical protein